MPNLIQGEVISLLFKERSDSWNGFCGGVVTLFHLLEEIPNFFEEQSNIQTFSAAFNHTGICWIWYQNHEASDRSASTSCLWYFNPVIIHSSVTGCKMFAGLMAFTPDCWMLVAHTLPPQNHQNTIYSNFLLTPFQGIYWEQPFSKRWHGNVLLLKPTKNTASSNLFLTGQHDTETDSGYIYYACPYDTAVTDWNIILSHRLWKEENSTFFSTGAVMGW